MNRLYLLMLFKHIPIRGLHLLDKLNLSASHHYLINTAIETRIRFSETKSLMSAFWKQKKRTTLVFERCGCGGITDRFKAIVSLFDFCERKGIKFAINSKKPYDFDMFFGQAEYDWYISDMEVDKALTNHSAMNLWLASGTKMRQFSWDDQQIVLHTIAMARICSHLIIHASAPYGLPQFGKRFRQ